MTLSMDSDITSGGIYQEAVRRAVFTRGNVGTNQRLSLSQRIGAYLGKTAQNVPHVTGAIQDLDGMGRQAADPRPVFFLSFFDGINDLHTSEFPQPERSSLGLAGSRGPGSLAQGKDIASHKFWSRTCHTSGGPYLQAT